MAMLWPSSQVDHLRTGGVRFAYLVWASVECLRARWLLEHGWEAFSPAVLGGGRILSASNDPRIDQVDWAVRSAGRRVLRGPRVCLAQAVACQRMLAAIHVDCCLRFGLERQDFVKPLRRVTIAHAWVECAGGRVVGSSSSQARATIPFLSE